MSKTKGDLVREALTEIGIAEYEFDISPEEIGQGVSRLNSMMSLWDLRGVKLGFNFTGGPGEASGIPTTAEEAVVTNLSLRLAPTYGRQVPPEVKKAASVSMRSLYNVAARPIEMQFGHNLPVGAGYKDHYDVFFEPKERFPWKIEEFDDFSGGQSPFYLESVGDIIVIDLTDKVDLSTATATSIRYRKPSGNEGEWAGTVVDDTITYTTVAGDLDEAGVWYIQGEFVLPTITGSSTVRAIQVENVIGD